MQIYYRNNLQSFIIDLFEELQFLYNCAYWRSSCCYLKSEDFKGFRVTPTCFARRFHSARHAVRKWDQNDIKTKRGEYTKANLNERIFALRHHGVRVRLFIHTPWTGTHASRHAGDLSDSKHWRRELSSDALDFRRMCSTRIYARTRLQFFRSELYECFCESYRSLSN